MLNQLCSDATLTPPVFIDSDWCERTTANYRLTTTESTSTVNAEVLVVLQLKMGKWSQCFRVQHCASYTGGRTGPQLKSFVLWPINIERRKGSFSLFPGVLPTLFYSS